jgi:head-tail adaptor
VKLADITPGLEVEVRYDNGRGTRLRKATVTGLPEDRWVPCAIEISDARGPVLTVRNDTVWYTQVIRPWAVARAENEARRADADARKAKNDADMRAAYQTAHDTVADQIDQLTASGLFSVVRASPTWDDEDERRVRVDLEARDVSLWAALVAYSVSTEDPSRGDETALIDLIANDTLTSNFATKALIAAFRGDHTPFSSSFGRSCTIPGIDRINQFVLLVNDFVFEHPDKVVQLAPQPKEN